MSYLSEVVADSPLFYWRLGDSSGTTAADASGNSNPGTLSGSVTFGATSLLIGDADTAATFSGGVVFRAASSASIFTASAIIKPSSVSGTQVIMSMQDAGSAAWTFRLGGAGLEFYYWDASNVQQGPIVASTTIVAGTTYRTAVTFTASGSVFLYVDGAQVGSASVSTMHSISSSTLLRVGGSGGGENFSGVIDEPFYCTTALSGARIAAQSSAALGGGTDATVTPPVATATALAPVPSISDGSGDATVTPPAATATATALAPTFTQIIPVGTDTSNSLNGRRRRARASVVVTRPAAATPSRAAVKYDKSVPYPPPTLVNGRPT